MQLLPLNNGQPGGEAVVSLTLPSGDLRRLLRWAKTRVLKKDKARVETRV